MFIYPAIDLFENKAVRLYKGDYAKMTVYSEEPERVALDFKACGASHIHLVDLQGAKEGTIPNFDTVCKIKRASGLFCEIGGGIRSMDVIDLYVNAGIDRVILGTAAVTYPDFARNAVREFGSKIAVGVDIRDNKVAVKGWTETSNEDAFEFCKRMEDMGISTLICTDISKDGAMKGTNLELYKALRGMLKMNIIASGGVSSMEDVKNLNSLDIHGAIIGKAYYTGAIDLREAVKITNDN